MTENEEHTSWKLSDSEKETVTEWLVIFSNRDVHRLMKRYKFPQVSDTTLTYHRKQCADTADELRERFRVRAMEKGWSRKEARVTLLNDMLADWGSRKPDGKEVTEMALKIEKQLSERVDDLAIQRVKLEFDTPKSMLELVEGLKADE